MLCVAELTGELVVDSSSVTARPKQQPLAEVRAAPIDQIPQHTRAAVLGRIVTRRRVVAASFGSAL